MGGSGGGENASPGAGTGPGTGAVEDTDDARAKAALAAQVGLFRGVFLTCAFLIAPGSFVGEIGIYFI